MSHNTSTIGAIIGRINSSIFLPAIQREFVWKPTQIAQFYNSLMRGYPIGSFLFWNIEPKYQQKWEIYNFSQNFVAGDHQASLKSAYGTHNLVLVLDGQQRLTSLLIGLKGTYTFKPKSHQASQSPDKRNLYVDLFKDFDLEGSPLESDENVGFRFLKADVPADSDHLWFKIAKLMGCKTPQKLNKLKREIAEQFPTKVTSRQRLLCERNLSTLYDVIWKQEAISYYTEKQQDYNRALDIFIRANQGGTRLSKSDLLMSTITARWEQIEPGINARDEINDFVQNLNQHAGGGNNFTKDFVMKACLVLCDLPVKYNVNQFTSANLQKIFSQWQEIKVALLKSVGLVNSFGIKGKLIISQNALIPVAYYCFKNPRINLHGASITEVRNAGKVRRWFTTALLNNVFSGNSDTALVTARKQLKAQSLKSQEFPDSAMNKALSGPGRTATFDTNALERFLSHKWQDKETFLALSLLYDCNDWGTQKYHVDHIFPRKMFTAKNMNDAGIDQDQQEFYREHMDSIGNLELLSATENTKKSAKDFSDWVVKMNPAFKKQHLIPPGQSILQFDHFDDFIAAREQLIRKRLKGHLK